MDIITNIQEGIIFSIEEFAVNDGPGIRTTIFLKGCPLRCAWCHNPEGLSPQPQYMIKKNERVLCGYKISADKLADQVLRNKEIYTLNKGGITLTGGEPLLQANFVIDFLRRIKPSIHTAIETSGYASPDTFQKVLPWLDLVLFDIKHMDSEEHRKYVGVDNKTIQKNLRHLCSSGKDFIIRIPLIPGVNDSKENMLAILNVIKDSKSLQRVEILRYNKIAGAKYPMIGQEYQPPFDQTAIPNVYDVFTENNIKTIVL